MGTRRIGWFVTMVALTALVAAGAAAQRARTMSAWQTPAGGDAHGNYVRVELVAHEGSLRGRRRVERIDAPSGYTAGAQVTVVLAGREPEPNRTLHVKLPYGATLDLAVGDVVDVDASSHLVGLGSDSEVLMTRRGEIILLATSVDRGGVRVVRGADAGREGSRHQWGVRITWAGQDFDLPAHQLMQITPGPYLVQGLDVAFEGPRPPDAFDSRNVTIVRIRPPSAAASH